MAGRTTAKIARTNERIRPAADRAVRNRPGARRPTRPAERPALPQTTSPDPRGSQFPSVKQKVLDALSSPREFVRDLLDKINPKNRAGRNLAKFIDQADPKTIARIMDTTGGKAQRALDLYRTGLEKLGLTRWQDMRINLPESPRALLMNEKLGQIATMDIHPVEQILLFATKIESLRFLNDLLGNTIPQIEIETNAIKPQNAPKVLSLVTIYAHDKGVIARAESAVIEMAQANPKEMVPQLVKTITSSNAESIAEAAKADIALKALAASGKEGVSALLDIYSETSNAGIKSLAHRSLLGFNFGTEIIADPLIKAKLVDIILNDESGAQMAIKYLRSMSLRGKAQEANREMAQMRKLIEASQDESVQAIVSKSKGYAEALKKELKKAFQQENTSSTEFTLLLKAILAEYGMELSESGYNEEAHDVLRRALNLGGFGESILEIRYAIAFNLLGLSETTSGMEHLRKAIELDTSDLTEMFMSFERIGTIGDERHFANLGKHFEDIGEIKKATALYALGYLINNKYSEPDVARIFMRTLMDESNAELWQVLEARLQQGRDEFVSLLNQIASRIKAEDRRVHGNVEILPRRFSARVQDAIDSIKLDLGLVYPLAA